MAECFGGDSVTFVVIVLDENSIADEAKKPILFGIVSLFVLFGASMGRTFAEVARYVSLSTSRREDAIITTSYWLIPSVLVGSLVGLVMGIVIERKIDGPVPIWIFALAAVLLLSWLFGILLLPAMPPPRP